MPSSHPRRWGLSPSHVDFRGTVGLGESLSFGATPQSVTIDLGRTALIVVDMQNDFCSAGGWLDSIGVDVSPAAAAIEPINSVARGLRARGVPVLWLNWGNRPDRSNLPPNVLHVYDPDGTGGGIGDRVLRSDAVLTKDSWGAQLVDGLHVAPEDLHIDKYRMSGFFDTSLDSVLRARRTDTLLFAGVNADQCVFATLIDAACLGYDVVMIEQASATTSPGFCLDATIYNVRQCFGFTATAHDIVTALES